MINQPAPGIIPLSMCSATVSLDRYTPGWTLADFVADMLPAPRYYYHDVVFDRPFGNIPVVQAAISGFDIDNCDTGRLAVEVHSITPTGFRLSIKTWLHSRVYRVDVNWLAIGSSPM